MSMDAAAKLAAEIVKKRAELQDLERRYAKLAPRAELTTKPRTVREVVDMYGPQSFAALMKITGLPRPDLWQQCQLHGLHKWTDGVYHGEPEPK